MPHSAAFSPANIADLCRVISLAKPLPAGAAPLAYVVKVEPELRVVWGWASVIEEAGETVVDRQGDIISEADLMTAAHAFVAKRTIKAMHRGEPIGSLVESVVMTKSLQAALGIDLGLVGWLIGARIEDDAAWAAVKAGAFPAFSIGGTGVRIGHDA